jgi:antitoxin component YwqK of YwqJK toxin-antitoxin module
MNLKKSFSRYSTSSFDPYWEFDKKNHFRPLINQGDYFRLSGSDFCWLILEPLSDFFSFGDFENEEDATRLFSYGQKALYFWWYLDGQVSNGGFVQCYYNGYGDYIPAIIKGLEYIGDTEMAKLVKRVDKVYQKNKKIIEKDKAKNGWLLGSDLYEQLDDLAAFDGDYFDLNDNTMERIENYCRQNPDEFCLTQNGQSFKGFSGLCKTFYDSNTPKEIFQIENNTINGTFQSFYQNGQLKEIIEYQNGEKVGDETIYFEDGKVKKSIKVISNNVLEHHFFYKNGNPKKLEYRTKDKDERCGIYKEWYENGQLSESGTYISNYKRDGEWLEFYEDGSKKMEADFVDGIKQIHNFWNEKGDHLLKNGTGTYISTRFSLSEFYYKNYQRHGVQKTYNEDGVMTVYQEFEEGKRHGYTRSFYKNGNIKEEKLFKNDKKVSQKEFPMFQNPKVITTIECKMEDEWLVNRELPTADTYPKPINHIELAKNFEVNVNLFDNYPDDYELSYSYFVHINKEGEPTEMNFSIASNGFIIEEVEANIKKLRFKPAIKDGQAVDSYSYVKHKLVLGE